MSERIRRVRGRGGFSLVELLIYLVIAVVVIAAIYNLLIGQSRLYMKQRELQDVRSSLRAAGNLLAFEFRQASAAEGDIYSIAPNSFAIRSIIGTGIICAEHASKLRYGLWGTSGEFYATADDSALIFAAGNATSGDDVWKVVAHERVWDPKGGGVAKCAWGDTLLGKGKGLTTATADDPGDGTGRGFPDLVMEVVGDMDDIYMGASYRAFRRVEYGVFQEDGRWWLGRRVGTAASYEKLAGPLRQPSDSGLLFTYYDQTGNVTTNPNSVRMVDILLRAESFGKVPRAGAAPGFQQDTLTIRVSLRG